MHSDDQEGRDLKEEALESLRRAFGNILAEEPSEDAGLALEERTLATLLDVAWRHQFDDNPAAFKRELKAALRESAEVDL